MMASSISHLGPRLLPICRIGSDDPARWLAAGWEDFRRAPLLSLGYGAIFVLAGYVIAFGLHWAGLGALIPVAIAGFFLVAPILAVGLYEVSRCFERGEPPSLALSLKAIRGRLPGLAGMGLLLTLSLAAWLQIALLIFMGFFEGAPPGLDHFLQDIVMAPNAVTFLFVGTAVGYVLASLVFAISAVSIPLLLERDVPLLSAIGTSLWAVRANWLVMLGWAATIVLLVGIGIVTFFFGLMVVLPLTAYATWHAYRSLVEPP